MSGSAPDPASKHEVSAFRGGHERTAEVLHTPERIVPLVRDAAEPASGPFALSGWVDGGYGRR